MRRRVRRRRAASSAGPRRFDGLTNAISSSLDRTDDRTEILRAIARAAAVIMNVPFVSCWTADESTATLHAAAASDDATWRDYPARIRGYHEGVSGEIVRTRRPVAIADVTTDPRIAAPEWLGAHGFRSYLGVPLLFDGTVVGVLNLNDRRPIRLTANRRMVLDALAVQAAIAIENARRLTISEHRRQTAEALAEVGRQLSETLDLQVVAGRITASIRELSRASRATVYRLDALTGDLHAVAKSIADAAADVGRDDRVAAGTAAVGRAVQDRAPLATCDLLADPRITLTPEQRERLGAAHNRAALAVPLLAQGHVVGALSINDDTGRVFTEAEVRLVQAFADQAALGLENARHFGEMERRAERLEALARVTQLITGAIDPGEVFRFITRSAMGLLDAKIVRLWLARDDATLALDAVCGRETERINALTRSSIIPFGQGLVGRIAQSRQPEFVRDITTDERWINREAVAQLGPTAFAGVPLIVDDRVVGVLSVLVGADRRFESEERDLLQVFADQAAIAIEKSRLYERARQALTELQVKNAELDSFVYMASHDLRAPLVTIQGMVSLLVEDFPGGVGERGRHYVNRIANAIEQMERLIADLLTLSRIGRDESAVESICLSELVDAILGSLDQTVRARGVKIVRGDLDIVVPAVRTRLTQVFGNLIGNALKYLGDTDQACVEIGAVDRGEHVECFVRDNGIGIDPEYHAKIFDVFERLKDVPVDGTGVGLAIVKKIVEAAGGQVRVASARGEGATFFFTWPKTRRPS